MPSVAARTLPAAGHRPTASRIHTQASVVRLAQSRPGQAQPRMCCSKARLHLLLHVQSGGTGSCKDIYRLTGAWSPSTAHAPCMGHASSVGMADLQTAVPSDAVNGFNVCCSHLSRTGSGACRHACRAPSKLSCHPMHASDVKGYRLCTCKKRICCARWHLV